MTEHTIQSALVAWARLHEPQFPELGFLFAVPNGGWRHIATARALRAEGCRAGVWDLFLPVPRGGYHGLWLETKCGRNNLTPEQDAWGRAMVRFGFMCEVYRDWIEGSRIVLDYLELPEPKARRNRAQ